MMQNVTKDPGPEEKMELLRQHLGDRIPLAELSRRSGIATYDLDQWRRQLFERGDRLFRDDAIPVGLKFEFEQFAAKACEQADLDGKDRSLAARNLTNQLEQDWLANIEAGLGTEAAQAKVYEQFGQLEQVAHCLRQPYWLRLLFYEDYRPTRMLIVMAYAFLLGASTHAADFHKGQFYLMSVGVTPGGLLAQFVTLLFPLNFFLVPATSTSQEGDGSKTKPAPAWTPSVKQIFGVATLGVLGWSTLHRLTGLPFFLVAVDAWDLSLWQLAFFWILSLAAIPSLGCIAAETFFVPGPKGEKSRRRFLRFLAQCDAGKLLPGT